MKLFDKIKSGLTGFSKMLSSVDVPNVDDPDKILPNELKKELAFADGLAGKMTDMIKPKEEKKFTARFNSQAMEKKDSKSPEMVNSKDIDKKEEQKEKERGE